MGGATERWLTPEDEATEVARAGDTGGWGGKEIKQDYVDASEEFWQLHSPPTDEEVKSISERTHPHVRDFNKLSVSPLFGVSKVKRPVDNIEST